MRRRDMLAGAAVALALAVPATPAIAADHTIKIAYETSETHLKARTAKMFAEEVEALSAGRTRSGGATGDQRCIAHAHEQGAQR